MQPTIVKPPGNNPGDFSAQLRGVTTLAELLKNPDTKAQFDQFHRDVEDWLKWKDEIVGVRGVQELLAQAQSDKDELKARKAQFESEMRLARENFDQHQADGRAKIQEEAERCRAELDAMHEQHQRAREALDARGESLRAQEQEMLAALARAKAAETTAGEVRERFEAKENALKALLGG